MFCERSDFECILGVLAYILREQKMEMTISELHTCIDRTSKITTSLVVDDEIGTRSD
jgi:hypothetical protein